MGSSPSKPPFDPYNQPWMYDPAYAWKRGSLVGKAYMEAIKNGANNQEGGGLAGFGNEPTNDPFGGGNVNNPFGGGNANNPSSRGQANAQNIANPWMANESEFNQATNTPFVEPNRGGSRIGPSILRLSALGSQMVGQVPTAGPTQFSHTGGGGGRDLNHGGRNDALEPGGQTMGGLHVRGHEGESVYPTSGRISGASGSPGPGYHASSRSINDGRGSGRGGSSSRTNRGPASGYRRGTSRGRGNNANIPRPGNLSTISERSEFSHGSLNRGIGGRTQIATSGRRLQQHGSRVPDHGGQTLAGVPPRGIHSETASGPARSIQRGAVSGNPGRDRPYAPTASNYAYTSTVGSGSIRDVAGADHRRAPSISGQTVAEKPPRGMASSTAAPYPGSRGQRTGGQSNSQISTGVRDSERELADVAGRTVSGQSHQEARSSRHANEVVSNAPTVVSLQERSLPESRVRGAPSISGQTIAGQSPRDVQTSSSAVRTERTARATPSTTHADGRSAALTAASAPARRLDNDDRRAAPSNSGQTLVGRAPRGVESSTGRAPSRVKSNTGSRAGGSQNTARVSELWRQTTESAERATPSASGQTMAGHAPRGYLNSTRRSDGRSRH